MSNRVSTCLKRYRLLNKQISDEAILRLYNGSSLPPPQPLPLLLTFGMVPETSCWGRESLWVCLCHVLTLVFSLSDSTPLSYCLARWLPRYFSNLSVCVLMHAWPGARCCGLLSPAVFNKNGKKKASILHVFSAWPFCIGEPAQTLASTW